MTKDEEMAFKWLISGEVGMSSKAMLAAALGIEQKNKRHPLDPYDFKRCLNMVDSVPFVKKYFYRVAYMSHVWANIIYNWDELEKLYSEESNTGSCPKMYARMKELGC